MEDPFNSTEIANGLVDRYFGKGPWLFFTERRRWLLRVIESALLDAYTAGVSNAVKRKATAAFKPGALVRFRTDPVGTPPMIVVDEPPNVYIFFGNTVRTWCAWRLSDGSVKTDNFPTAALEPAPTARPKKARRPAKRKAPKGNKVLMPPARED